MGFTDQDRLFMLRAIELAEKGRGYVEPNPMVGAVLVKEGRVVGEGFHERFGGPHAEVIAVQKAGADAAGATLYVSLEPCAHYGKTPPCAPLVASAGIARVVVAVLDPTPKTSGKGLALLRQAGIPVEVGLCREEAVRQNAGFFKLAAVGRPLVIAKWAMSADGKIASRSGSARWISSSESRRVVHRLRGQVDCIIVGRGTVEADDPELTCRDAERHRAAVRLVLCGKSAPAPSSRLFSTAREGPIVLAYVASSRPAGLEKLVEMGCEALPITESSACAGMLDLGTLLDELGRRQMTNVLVEGGARTFGSFFDAGLVDRVLCFIAPIIIGGAGAPSAVAGRGVLDVADALRLNHLCVSQIGGDVLIDGWAVDPLQWAA